MGYAICNHGTVRIDEANASRIPADDLARRRLLAEEQERPYRFQRKSHREMDVDTV